MRVGGLDEDWKRVGWGLKCWMNIGGFADGWSAGGGLDTGWRKIREGLEED